MVRKVIYEWKYHLKGFILGLIAFILFNYYRDDFTLSWSMVMFIFFYLIGFQLLGVNMDGKGYWERYYNKKELKYESEEFISADLRE